MSEIIKAASKYNLTDEVLKKMAEKAVGEAPEKFRAKELAGGLCNAVYLLEADGQKYVAKIAPPKDAVMMRHERDIISTEAAMLKIMERLSVPAPRLMAYDDSCTTINVPYFVMTFMEGEPLMFMQSRPPGGRIDKIKFELGAICKKISTVKGDFFGIPAMPETHFGNNADFIMILFENLLNDCADKGIKLPYIAPENLMALVERFRGVLNEAESPCLVHTDTWEGNLMIKDGKLMGLIDFAAMLYGDPLLNHDFHDFSPAPNPHFLKGYGKESFTRSEWTRIVIYKIWQRLGMIAERIYRNYEDKNLYLWVMDEFEKEVVNLESIGR